MRKFLLTLISFAFVLSAWAQERIVSGKVSSSEDGSSLPGVNVVLKGTANGAVSDADGNYKLSVPAAGGTLVFSFIGLLTQEVEIGSRSSVDVQMASDVKQLSEVVVTAQGIRSEKKALGYSVTTVGGNALQQRPEQDVARMMTGKIPGVQINQTNGMSGTGTSIIIRGFSTISGSNQPLFVIDGVPFNTNTNQQGDYSNGSLATSSRFLDLDPNNIESMSVLKGLSATVLYGEQGKKGVILITTKNGSTRKKDFEITVNQSVFANKIASLPEYQNNYGNGFNGQFGFFFSNWGPHFDDGSPLSKINTPKTIPHPYSHWGDPTLTAQFPQYQGVQEPYVAQPDISGFFRTGVISNTSLNIGGSSEKLNYNANFGYSKEEGFVPGNSLSKVNGGVGITGQLTKKLSINSTLNFARTQMETPPISSAGAGGGISGNGFSLFSELMFTPRNVDLLHLPFETPADHRSVYYRTGNDIQNPLWTAKYSRQTDNVNRFYGKTSLTYDINDHLNVVYRLGLDTYSEQQEYIVNKGGVQNSSYINGLYRTFDITNTIWDHSLLLNYNKDINQDLNLTATVGGNYRQDTYRQNGEESVTQIVFGFVNHSNFQEHSSTNGFTGQPMQFETEKIWAGAYATATLGYKDYLFFNAAARNDWTSTLEKANASLFYPSASVSFVPTTAWNLESKNLNYLKLRLGYGTSAGFPNPYLTRNTLDINGRGFVDASGVAVATNALSSRLGNAGLKPELQAEIEFGVEGKFFNNRVGVDLSIYRRTTTNLITNAPLDPSTGYLSTTKNVGELENKGIELALTGTPLIMGDFKWDVTLNFFKYNSTITSLTQDLSRIQIAGFTSPGNYAVAGEPYGMIYGYQIARSSTGQRLVDGTGLYLQSDNIAKLGSPIPDYTLSFINGFSYKGINLSFQFDYRKGGMVYSQTAGTVTARGTTKDTDGDRYLVYIQKGVKESDPTKPNDIPIHYADMFYSNVLNYGIAELAMYDGTTIRLREISLGYSLPKSVIGKTPFKAVAITLSGQNLWYNAVNFPKYLNFDTDVLSSGVGNGMGLDFMSGPTSRRYGASLKLTF